MSPALLRQLSGVLVPPADLAVVLGQRARASGPERAPAVGGLLDASAVPAGVDDATGLLGRLPARAAARGARIAGWTADLDGGMPGRATGARLAACFAAGCRDAGLPVVLQLRPGVPERASLEDARSRLRDAVALLLDALDRRGVDPADVTLVVPPVAPGRGAHAVASADDVALATSAALGDAGLEAGTAVALTAADRPHDLAGRLFAARVGAPGRRWGFAIGDGTGWSAPDAELAERAAQLVRTLVLASR
ncbi:hypothetical protein [Pseudonocardia endophytica]|uniref:Uncharacterized protein n=1 Tax=Pseudonocardia endophytica TaxID=401976 RepID=A0A4R1I055_PSEEN|nr:hypothetical protein [Pseudonocardia endophytica]TCK27223.1 hypothetical protein EV378_3090 [Pseudonocardia endophytica]